MVSEHSNAHGKYKVVNELLDFQEPNEGQSGRRAGERLAREL